MATVSEPFTLVVQANWGYLDYTTTQIAAYQEPVTTTIAFAGIDPNVTVAASTSNQALNLSTTFPGLTSAQFLYIEEVTNPPTGFSIALSNGGAALTVAAGGFFAVRLGGGALPTVYLTNPNSTTSINLSVGVASN